MTSYLQPLRISIGYVLQAFKLSDHNDQKCFDLVIIIDVDPTECGVKRCITPDEIGCIMGYAAKSSEFSIKPFLPQYNVFSRPGRGVERFRDWVLFRKVVPINGYQVMIFPYCAHEYCTHRSTL